MKRSKSRIDLLSVMGAVLAHLDFSFTTIKSLQTFYNPNWCIVVMSVWVCSVWKSLWFCCFTAKVKEKECCALSFRNISGLPGVFVICYDKYSKLKLDLELSYKNCLVLQEKMEWSLNLSLSSQRFIRN